MYLCPYIFVSETQKYKKTMNIEMISGKFIVYLLSIQIIHITNQFMQITFSTGKITNKDDAKHNLPYCHLDLIVSQLKKMFC